MCLQHGKKKKQKKTHTSQPTNTNLVASSKRVSATESNDLLVSESHAVENGTQVISPLGRIGQAAIRRGLVAPGTSNVRAPGRPLGTRTTQGLNGDGTGQRIQVGIGHARILSFQVLEEVAGNVEPRVASVAGFRLEAHGCTVGSARFVELGVVSSRVPGEADEKRAVATQWGPPSVSEGMLFAKQEKTEKRTCHRRRTPQRRSAYASPPPMP